MTGIRKRVTVGFVSIVVLLFVSGMISFFELSRVSGDTEEILKANQRSIELAKDMLNAAHEQNVAFIHLTIFGDNTYDSLCRASMAHLENTLAVAHNESVEKSSVDSLVLVITDLRLLTDGYLAFGANENGDYVNPNWYNDRYEKIYGKLMSAVKNYMTSTQSSLAPSTEQLKKNAYRAVTPVLISLIVMIITVLMLFYFMTIYCVNPILKMNKALGDYLSFRIPFTVKADCMDEMQELKEKIDTVITISKQNKV